MKHHISLLCLIAMSLPASDAAELELQVELPRLDVAQYNRPYLAVWIERGDQSVVGTLAVWYEVSSASGVRWLPDLRQWWRRTGREQTLPVDGLTGATRPAGTYRLRFVDGQTPLGQLPSGDYVLAVEAAREAGGREVLRIPFSWPATAATSASAQGVAELGQLRLTVTP
jgi:hypothetical protein